MVTKWALSQRGKRELTPHLPKVFILRWMEVSCLTDGRLTVASQLMEHETHLNREDFKRVDGEHQAVNHFVRLLGKGPWEGHKGFTKKSKVTTI